MFDADNTLLDFDACEKEALKKTFEAYNCPLRDDMKNVIWKLTMRYGNRMKRGNKQRRSHLYSLWKIV